ncbi:hypothetical protein [Roseomonas marmotae]|uniref:Uncharacterized protein n=1 Tax=Roseomonas marmotae TaxID=2768161 RepID=A0ABS3KGE1_9PROT|nr:hypothetical protein [Roseomonas marmotae]MBO1076519.1 hypothetical protein [Roseomonas marmotae]QTI81863.1 hypothetical protein IAI58_21190 [Roseomonas marmotae]
MRFSLRKLLLRNAMVRLPDEAAGSEVLSITSGPKAVEQWLRAFNAADAHRQRMLGGRIPGQLLKERLRIQRKLARPGTPEGRAGSKDIAHACLIAEGAKAVSQPDS